MIVRIDYPEPDARLDLWGGTTGAFAGLDRFGRVVDQRWQTAVSTTPADADRYQYGYDRNSNRTWKRNAVAAAASVPLDEFYAYDRLNRLNAMQRGTLAGTPPTGIAGTPALEQDWTLDPTGNWRGYATAAAGTTTLDQARSSNPVNQVTGIIETAGPSWADPAYDPAGNTTSFPQPANPTQTYAATYDAWNRLTGVDDGASPVARHAYDGRNRRVVTDSYAGGTLAETRHAYFTAGWQDVEERVGTATAADAQHVWGVRYIDELVCRDRPALAERVYACQDANFNVTALLDAAAGAVAQRLVYEPYGNDSVLGAAWAAAADAYAWAVRFQGLPLDLDTGLYLARFRDYLPGLGAWLMRDPVQHGSASTYGFLLFNPVGLLDPSGTIEVCADVANNVRSEVELGSTRDPEDIIADAPKTDFVSLYVERDQWSGSSLKLRNDNSPWKRIGPEEYQRQFPNGEPLGPYCRVYVIDGCIRTVFRTLYPNPVQVEGSNVLEAQVAKFNRLARAHEDKVIAELKAIWGTAETLCDCDDEHDVDALKASMNARYKRFRKWINDNHAIDHPPLRDTLSDILKSARIDLKPKW